MRRLTAAVVWFVVLLVASPEAFAAEPSAVWKDGWTINTPAGSNWLSDGRASAFQHLGTTSAPYTPGLTGDPYAFADYSIGHTLRFGRDYGLGDMQATLGVRTSEPLASEPVSAFDPRRYMGVGPRLGFEGNKPLPSAWVFEWKLGASVLYADRTFDVGSGLVNPMVPNYGGSGSALNVDGLLGLSYWFDSASKLTVGYRADYFKTPSLNVTGTSVDNADRVNHGPMIRFSIEK
jgi:hypothetical protein